jgi:hypothetical protein
MWRRGRLLIAFPAGTPTPARRPNSRTASAIGPEASSWSSIRAARPVWNTSVGTFRYDRN